MTREIELSKGMVALVDDEDFVRLAAFSWSAQEQRHGGAYAVRCYRVNGRQQMVRMHRFLMNAPEDAWVDHINGNGLDNRKENLRVVSARQNNMNRSKSARTSGGSRFKGVTLRKSGLWMARITVNGKDIYLGSFDFEEDAAAAYNAKASELFGEYAKLNTM